MGPAIAIMELRLKTTFGMEPQLDPLGIDNFSGLENHEKKRREWMGTTVAWPALSSGLVCRTDRSTQGGTEGAREREREIDR